MYKIYLPIAKGKQKSLARGFWQDKQKIYYDYIDFKSIKERDLNYIEYLRREYNQLAVFFEDITESKAYIKDNTEDLIILNQKKIFRVNKSFKGLKSTIKSFLRIYGGLTIFKRIDCYIIEAWS